MTHTPAQDRRAEQPAANSVTLRVANGPLAAPVLGRVISMVLARTDCPMDRLDDAMILCDALSAHAPAHARDGHIDFTMATDERGIDRAFSSVRRLLCTDGCARGKLRKEQRQSLPLFHRLAQRRVVVSRKQRLGQAKERLRTT